MRHADGVLAARVRFLRMADLWLQDVRIAGSSASTDIVIEGGRILSVGPAPREWSARVIDGEAHLALPGLVDGHAHVGQDLVGPAMAPALSCAYGV